MSNLQSSQQWLTNLDGQPSEFQFLITAYSAEKCSVAAYSNLRGTLSVCGEISAIELKALIGGNDGFSRVELGYFSEKYRLYPNTISNDQIAAANDAIDNQDAWMTEDVPGKQMRFCFQQPDLIGNYLNILPQAHVSPLQSSILKYNYGQGVHLNLVLLDTQMHLSLFVDGVLKLMNHFGVNTEADLGYYVLYALEMSDISGDRVACKLVGTHSRMAAIKTLLANYLGSVTIGFENLDGDVQMDANKESYGHHYFQIV